MKLAFYEGRSFVSRLIKWVTWGKYSHVAVILDDGRILEAWHKPNGVRWIDHLGCGHEAGTLVEIFDVPELPHHGAADVLAEASVGAKYDFWGIVGFAFRRRFHNRRKWFCSELAATICKVGGVDLIARTPPWKISPSLLATSALIVPYGRAITGKKKTPIYPYPNNHMNAGPTEHSQRELGSSENNASAPASSPASAQPNDSITAGEAATVSPSANTADPGDLSKRETKRIEVCTAEAGSGAEERNP